jgi:ABC-type transport system involved in multi-copper enzyme maturation permease subunit
LKVINTLRNIAIIASNERRMLYRQARFWVLTIIGLVGILFFMVVMTIITIVEDNIPGEFLLEGTDAYLALYFFSYLQAILIIFIAGDFRKSEEKSQLDQVMLSRPMTTANWVIGKYAGVVSAVLLVNVFLIMVATIGRTMKVIFAGAGFNVLPFFKYFVIASLPSILFMSAFMFFLVSLFRAQAVAVIVSLGYVAGILFYFHHDFLGRPLAAAVFRLSGLRTRGLLRTALPAFVAEPGVPHNVHGADRMLLVRGRCNRLPDRR